MIGYSDHPLIARSKASLGSSREAAQDCRVSFVNCLYLVPLIIAQNFCATCCATSNQTGSKLVNEVLNQVYLEIFSRMSVTFRDESNEASSIIID